VGVFTSSKKKKVKEHRRQEIESKEQWQNIEGTNRK
jgi:hypothetical protein